MSVFTIADLHLSTDSATNKSMEVFGQRWANYISRLRASWTSLVREEDTVIIPGDISWALSLEEAREDMHFLDSLPGTKILGKGNHDFWWATMKKHEEFLAKENICSIRFLFNNALEVEDFIIAGSRGWFYEDGVGKVQNEVDFEKITARELGRLRLSLDAAAALREQTGKEILVFLHFPVIWCDKVNEPFVALLRSYGVRRVYFGHIHSAYSVAPVTEYMDIRFELISADYLSFIPKHVPALGESSFF